MNKSKIFFSIEQAFAKAKMLTKNDGEWTYVAVPTANGQRAWIEVFDEGKNFLGYI